MSEKIYMKVNFYDNDYGQPVTNAIKRLWTWIHKNNAHCLRSKGKGDTHFSDRTLSDIFIELNNVDALVPMIERLIDSEYIAFDVEFSTRGLYWDSVDWKEKKIPKKMKRCTDYLNVDVSFQKTYSKNWQNGEVLILNTETGKVESL